MEEEKVEKLPNFEYAQMKFRLGLSDSLVPNKAEIKTNLMKVVDSESKKK